MSGVLDPEELTALMDGAEAARDGSGKYDLARQDYALHRLLPALNQLHGQFATAARDRLRPLLPTLDRVSIDSIAALRFEELQRRLPAPCSLALFRGLPDGAALLLALESELVFQMVDRYFGGLGGAAPGRETFSASEDSFTEQLQDLLQGDIAQAWKSVLKDGLSLALRCGDSQKLEEFSQRDTLVACRFLVSFGGSDDDLGFWVALPWAALEPLRQRVEAPANHGHKNADVRWQECLAKRLEMAPIELTALLAETEISLKRVVDFKIGDIIEIPAADQLLLSLDGRALLQGKLGSAQGNFAVCIEGPCRPDGE